MESAVDLIKVVRSSHPPFLEIIFEKEVAVLEFGWISFSFVLYHYYFEKKLPVLHNHYHGCLKYSEHTHCQFPKMA